MKCSTLCSPSSSEEGHFQHPKTFLPSYQRQQQMSQNLWLHHSSQMAPSRLVQDFPRLLLMRQSHRALLLSLPCNSLLSSQDRFLFTSAFLPPHFLTHRFSTVCPLSCAPPCRTANSSPILVSSPHILPIAWQLLPPLESALLLSTPLAW